MMFTLYDRIQVEGIMPERALLRLKRAGINLYDIQKIQNNLLYLRVKRKDLGKIFSIYPKEVDGERFRPYAVSKIGAVGLAKAVDFCKNRVGCLLGVLAFCILTFAADSFVFGVEFVGTDVYAREIMQALNESGIQLYAPYRKGQEDVIAAKILSLDFVEFCSVKKVGGRIRVETRISPFTPSVLSKDVMLAKHTGEIRSITVLRGTALKKAGDTVVQGEPLVGNWFCPEEEEKITVEPIARVRIACVYEGVYADAGSEQQAFAEGYLALNLGDKDEITEFSVTQIAKGFHVKISCIITETVNL